MVLTGELLVEVDGSVVLAKIDCVNCATMCLFPPHFPYISHSGQVEGSCWWDWLCEWPSYVGDLSCWYSLGGCSSAGREKCPCSDSGLDLHDRSRSWNSEDQGRLIWVWRNCHVPFEVRITWLSSARTRRTWAMSGAPWSRHRKFVVLDGLFGTMRRGGATWRVSGVMDVTGGRRKVAVVVELWWLVVWVGRIVVHWPSPRQQPDLLWRLLSSDWSSLQGWRLVEYRWWTWCRHRKCRWFRLTRRRCWWCLMDWWRRDRGWLVSLLMRNQLLKVVDMTHGLVV